MDPGLVVVWSVLLTVVLSEELYVTTPTSVLHIDTATLRTSTIVTKEDGRLLGLAADWRGERLYYTDVSPTGGGIYTANLQGGDVRKLPIQYPDMEPVGLAVDWVYGHLYWTDTVYRAVMMSNLDGTGRVTIVTENLIIPRGIAVDPDRRELYIGDQGKHAVQVCGLDGRNCRELNVTDDSDTFWPNQITIDYASRMVHWTDGWVPALYTCSIGGTNCQRKTGNLSAELGSNPAFGLAVGQSGQLYMSTLHNQSLYRSSLDLELTSVQITNSETKTFFLLKKEMGTSLPTVVTSNPCATNKGGCSDICLPHSGDNFTCMCPDGSGKLPVNKICQVPNQFLLFTDISRGIVGMASVDDSGMQTTIVRAVKPLAVVYHLNEKKVYFADARLRAIYKCNIDGSDVETVLNSSHGIGQVEGLSVDYRQNRLYFSNMGFEEHDGVLRSWHTIEMVDLDTKQRRTIVTSLEKPRAVVVDSERRVLYYTDWGSAGHVGRVSLDGSNRMVLATAENPNDLIITDNKLLIINNKQPTAEVIEIDLANSNGVVNNRQLSNVEPMSLAASGNNLLVSSFTGGLRIYSKSSLGQTFSSLHGQFTRMTVVDTTMTKQRDEGVCSSSDSCSDICVTSSQSTFFTCLCPTNQFNEQSSDRLSCQRPDSFILFADIDGIKMVPEGNTGDSHVYTVVYPSANCSHFYGLVVDENQRYIYFSALKGDSIFRANVDGSNMQKFVTDANGKITSLALSGNDLFWTSTNINDNSTGSIVHCDTQDTSRVVTLLYNTTAEPLDIAADESNIYWTERDSSTVKRLDRRDSIVRSSIGSGRTSAIGLTVPSSHLLYATDSSVTLRRFPTTSSASYLTDTIAESGVRNLLATRQFLYLSRWFGNSTGSIMRHDLTTRRNYDVTTGVVRPGQMVFISNQTSATQDKVGSCPSISSCSSTACFLDVDCYGSSKCCGTSQCTRCSKPEQGSDCIKDGVYIENSGGLVDFGCEKCSCLNGNLTCVPLTCPDLGSCPTENRIQPSGSCCPSCSATTACSSPPTIENCPTSTKSFLLPSDSDMVNITLDDVISATTYGKSCSGQKLNLDFTDVSLKYQSNLQTVTVSTSDKHGTATCQISIHIIDNTKPIFESCPNDALQTYITESNKVVTWSPVTARDNSGSVTLTSNLKNGIERSPGLYAVNYEAVDSSGNSEVCTFSIRVTMLQVCKSPPIPFNGLLSCREATQLTCQLEQCNTGFLNTLSATQTHTCDQTSGQWDPPFPSNFTNVCVKPRPSIIQREYIFEFNCPNSEFDAGDLQECISSARLCPQDDIKLCDRPFKRFLGMADSNILMNITMRMEGTLPYGGNLIDLTTRMDNVGKMIEDFFQTGNFKTRCPKINCPFSKATSKPDVRKCNIGSKTFLVEGKEICAPCPAGWFYNTEEDCSKCPTNTYQEWTGQTTCTACPVKTFSSTGSFLQSHCIQSSSQTHVTIESTNLIIIIIVVISVAILLVVSVAIVCLLKRKNAPRQSSSREKKFQNQMFNGQGNEAFSGPSVEEYDQIPADKILSESQLQNFQTRPGSGGDYESRANIRGEDHTYQGLKPAQGATNKAFSEESDYTQLKDYDTPNESVSNDYMTPLG